MNANGGLNSSQADALIDALIDAYPEWDEFDMLLFRKLDRSFEEIAGRGKLQSCVFKLVRNAMSEGWLHDLIAAAVERRPENITLRAWVEAHGHAVGLLGQSPMKGYELAKSMNFDLNELHKKIIGELRDPAHPVVGFALRYSEDVFLAKLCDWVESRASKIKRKDSLNLRPELGPVPERLRALRQYKRDLDSADVMCTVYAQGVSAEVIMEFWHGVRHDFVDIKHKLLLMVASDATAIFPEDMIELPEPNFEITDIELWTGDMIIHCGWPQDLASAWTHLLLEHSLFDGVLDIRCLYYAMDETIKDVQNDAKSFRQRLEGRMGHANPPQT